MTVLRGGRGPSKEEQEKRQAAAIERERVRVEQLHADLRVLVTDPRFQRFLQDLMVRCGTFDAQEHLTAEAYRVAARRAVGMEVLNELRKADAVAFAQLHTQMMLDILEAKEKDA